MLGAFLRMFWHPFGPRPDDEPEDTPEPVESLDAAGDLMAPILRGFGYTTVDAVANASVAELATLDPVPHPTASRLYREACGDDRALEDTIAAAHRRAECLYDQTPADDVACLGQPGESVFVPTDAVDTAALDAGMPGKIRTSAWAKTDTTVNVREER